MEKKNKTYSHGNTGLTKRVYSPGSSNWNVDKKKAGAFQKGFNKGGSMKDIMAAPSRLYKALTSSNKKK